MLNYPKRDGWLYSHKSTTFYEGPKLIEGLTAVKANPSIEGRDPVHGQGVIAYGFPRGKMQVEIGLTFVAEAFFDFVNDPEHDAYLDRIYTFTYTFEEGSRRDRVQIIGAHLIGSPIETEGEEGTVIELSGGALNMLINGKSIIRGDAMGQTSTTGGG